MKLLTFVSPEDYSFAQAIRHGSWFPKDAKLCPECNTTRQRRVSPLIMEWEAGSDMIGDFVWPGLNSDLVISQNVRNAFENRFREIKFGPVEFWQSARLKRPTRLTKRSKPRVWLPYEGTPLWDLIPTNWCHLDCVLSGISVDKVCSTCGTTFYKWSPRFTGHLVVDPKSWNGEDIFHIYELPGGIFCTEHVKEYVKQAGFTNVRFQEKGIIPD